MKKTGRLGEFLRRVHAEREAQIEDKLKTRLGELAAKTSVECEEAASLLFLRHESTDDVAASMRYLGEANFYATLAVLRKMNEQAGVNTTPIEDEPTSD